MPIFHMLVGLPGSGKTYYANKYLKQENTIILSSDEIRKALLGSEDAQWGNSIVFDTMKHAAIENLRQGRNVIYDATNINSKRRMGLLDQIKKEVKENIFFKVTILAIPYEICVERQQNRERKVHEEVINRMIKNFEVPYYEEGWDEIIVENLDFNEKNYISPYDFIKKYENYDQNNPHHNLTLGLHVKSAANRYNELVKSNAIKYNSLIEGALYFHDFGKPFCRTTDENGISHYYNHNNVGAYLFLCNFYSSIMFFEKEKIKVAKLIEWHMLELTEKAIRRRRIENTEYPQMLKIIQECDKYRKVDK